MKVCRTWFGVIVVGEQNKMTMEGQATLTPEQEAEMRLLKQRMPFRIVWAEVTKANVFTCYASRDRRAMNASHKAGNSIFMLK